MTTSTTVIPKLNIENDSTEEEQQQQYQQLHLPKRNIKKLTLERPKFYTMYSSDASRFPTLERIENNIKNSNNNNNKLDSMQELSSSKKGANNSGTQSDVKSISSVKSKRKKLRKHQTTTDIFANTLSEAVHDAAAYDSADDGYFYNNNHNGLAPTQTSNLYPPLSPPLPLESPTLNKSLSKNESEDYFSDYHHQKYRRPGLKSTVSELPARGVKSFYLKSMDLYKKQRKNKYTRYSTDEDEENAPLLYRNNRTEKKKRSGLCLGMSVMTVLLLLIACLFFIATPLTNVDIVAVTNVLGTQKQLIFDLHVRAKNNNPWSIQISHASFSLFATSHYVPTISTKEEVTSDLLEYLATIYKLEDPLIFQGSPLFSDNTAHTAISQVQIKNPGETNDDISGNERWSLLIRYPYELAIRGVLKHRLFMSKMYSSRICFIIKVDPSTGKITNIPRTEHAVCNDE